MATGHAQEGELPVQGLFKLASSSPISWRDSTVKMGKGRGHNNQILLGSNSGCATPGMLCNLFKSLALFLNMEQQSLNFEGLF